MPGSQSLKTVIIGGGMSGMVAALVLAKNGHAVTLLEKEAKLGPLLRGFSRKGSHFETGIHYIGGLGPRGPLTAYLRYLGLDTLPTISFDPECFDHIKFFDSEKSFCLPAGHEALSQTLLSAFPSEKRVILDYIKEVRQAFLSSAFLNFSENLYANISEPQWQLSLSSFLNQRTSCQPLKNILSVHCLLHGVSPDFAPFAQHAKVAGSYFDGAHTFAGGGKALVTALEQRLKECGVKVYCNSKVTSCKCLTGKAITEVILEDERMFTADFVIYTGNPIDLPNILPQESLRPAYKKHLQKLEDTISALMLFGKTNVSLPALHKKNLFICKENEPLTAAFLPSKKAGDAPFYIASGQNQDAAQDIIAITCCHNSVFSSYLQKKHTRTTRPQAYQEYKTALLEEFTAGLCRAMPEMSDVDFIEGATPVTLRDYLNTPAGGLYGCAHSIDQINPIPTTRIPNLFLAGQSIVAPGILGATVSAFLVCSFLLGPNIQKEVAACVH